MLLEKPVCCLSSAPVDANKATLDPVVSGRCQDVARPEEVELINRQALATVDQIGHSCYSGLI